MPRVTFMCCFCGQECPMETQVALIQDPGTGDAREQFWFAHFGCFEQSLHEDAKVFPTEEEWVDEEGEGDNGERE